MTAVREHDHGDGPDAEGTPLTGEQRTTWDAVVDGGWKLFATVNHYLADAGFTSTPDLRVMEALGRESQMRISDIAAATHIQMSTVSRQISRLIEQGMVERVTEIDEDDARHRWVRPTAEGSDYLDGLVRCRDAALREHVLSVLDEEEFRRLGEIFRKLA